MRGSRPSRRSSSSPAVGRTPGTCAAPYVRRPPPASVSAVSHGPGDVRPPYIAKVALVPRGRPYTRCPRCTWAAVVVGERASETKWTLIGSAAVGGSYAAAGVRTAWRRGRRRRDGTGSGEAGAQRASRRRRPRPVARRVGRSRLGGKCLNGAWRGRRGAATGRGQARARRRRRGPVAWCLRRADVARRVWWRGRRGTAAADTPLGPRSSEKVKRRWRGFSFSAALRWNLAQIGPRPRGRPRRDGRYGRRVARYLRRGVVGRAVGRRFGALPVQIQLRRLRVRRYPNKGTWKHAQKAGWFGQRASEKE